MKALWRDDDSRLIFMGGNNMDVDYVKSLIQAALWKTYILTSDEQYRLLYEKWYSDYAKITIIGLEECN